jgi:hypothetical protein
MVPYLRCRITMTSVTQHPFMKLALSHLFTWSAMGVLAFYQMVLSTRHGCLDLMEPKITTVGLGGSASASTVNTEIVHNGVCN